VGPRPLLVRYLNRYSPEQAQRHGVKPGITGLAQVRGRNSLSWEKRFENDVWYIQNWSLLLDCQILIETVSKVIRKDGISQEGYATCEEFIGTIQGTD
jgi:sugar transferase EpsL